MFTDQEKEELQEIIEKAISKKQRITKEEIIQEKNRDKRHKLITENMDLFIKKREE